MIIDLDKLSYDYDEKNNNFFITYRNFDFGILAHKLNILDNFQNVVRDNNGDIIGMEDEFYSEKDIENAISELKFQFDDLEYQVELFKNSLNIDNDITNVHDYIKWYFFMLDKESVEELMKHI